MIDDKGLFFNVYAQVCTRCFGSGSIQTTSMVPMADNLNHKSVGVTFELINIQKDIKNASGPIHGMKQYDYSLLAKSLGLPLPQVEVSESNDKNGNLNNIKVTRDYFMDVDSQIWHEPYKHIVFEEDNDTSDDEITDDEVATTKEKGDADADADADANAEAEAEGEGDNDEEYDEEEEEEEEEMLASEALMEEAKEDSKDPFSKKYKKTVRFKRNRVIDYNIFLEKLGQLEKPFTERVNTKSRNLRVEYMSDDVCGKHETKELKKKAGIKDESEEDDNEFDYLKEGFMQDQFFEYTQEQFEQLVQELYP